MAICGGVCFLIFGLLAIAEDPSIDYAAAIPAFLGGGGGGNGVEEAADAAVASEELAAVGMALNATVACAHGPCESAVCS